MKDILIIASMLACTASAIHAQPDHAAQGNPFLEAKIPGHAKGPAIIEALGERLPEVARWYGHTEEEFREMVEHDHSVHADSSGQLFYVCEALGIEDNAEGTTTGGSTSGEAAGPMPLAYNSNPTASRVIFLDFDGHVTTGTNWNASRNMPEIVTPAYDVDGDPSSFSTAELDNIRIIWERVSEDYAPWDVNVTTVDPGPEGLKKSSSSDTAYGIRVCIGGSSSDWYGSGGGVAYRNSFSYNTDTPCFVFENNLSNGNAKYVGEIVSHETGHTLSLTHDGNSSTSYYAGHGNWAPIMGNPLNKAVTHWSKGEYSGANNTQDDISNITNFIPIKADTVADDIATDIEIGATPVQGIIESRVDADVYRLTTDAGTVTVSATGVAPGNLDIRVTLYDSLGNEVATADPSTLAADLSASVSAGTYYACVEGSAPGDPVSSYNDYASIGQYEVSVAYNSSTNTAPVADAQSSAISGTAPLTVTLSSAGSYDPDGSIAAYDWDFADGGASTDANPTYTFSTPGVYPVSLVVFDNGGASASDVITITVESVQGNLPPVAVAQVSATNGLAPLTVNFSSADSYDADGSIASYGWGFADGSASSEANPTHTFNDPGVYEVLLLVNDNEGAQGTDYVTVTVNDSATNQPPVAIAQASTTSGVAPLTVDFTGADSYDPDGSIASYGWGFADGSAASVVAPSHTFADPGTYNVLFIIYDDSGESAYTHIQITVNTPTVNQAPVAVLQASATAGTGPLTVDFSGTGSYDPDGGNLSHLWNFGDGATATSASATHTYDAIGTYTVTLTVTDAEGLTDTTTTTITVEEPAAPTPMTVTGVSIAVRGNARKGYDYTATVHVTDDSGNPVQGATVAGAWSGLYSGNGYASTDSLGDANVTVKGLKSSGTITFTVQSVSLSGHVFDAAGSQLSASLSQDTSTTSTKKGGPKK